MDSASAPEVECEQQHAELFVSDIPAAVDFYTQKLGFKLAFLAGDPPHMAGVNLGNVQMFLQKGTPNPDGCSVYFVVGNADELFRFQRANGVEVVQEPGDREYGLRDYHVHDLHGYVLGFGHHLFNAGPPIEIERVHVPMRLEKRLAALLYDLAEYKRMSLSSCLEETLLHALVGVGPHTKTDLRHIEKLKEKHGIDYDSHGSYRFVESGSEGKVVGNRSAPGASVVPILVYTDVTEAVSWLCRVFGFTERLRVEHGGAVVHAQLAFADGAVMLGRQGGPFRAPEAEGITSVVHVTVSDVDGHFERAAQHGATIIQPPHDMPFGERQYTARDPQNHWWTFSQHIADVAPEDWGATSAR